MLKAIRTIYGGYIAAHRDIGKVYVPPDFTTLNQLWGIYQNAIPAANEWHTDGWIAIGNGANSYSSTNDISFSVEKAHSSKDAGLFKFLPFITREVGSDIDASIMQNYALPRLMDINGSLYWGWMARRFQTSGLAPEMRTVTIVNSVSSYAPFVPNNSNLTPTPPAVTPSTSTTVNGTFTNVHTPVTITFTADDAAELINSAEILYGNPRTAVISEIATIKAIEKSLMRLDQNGQPTTTPYNEAIQATITNIISADYNAYFNQGGFNMNFSLGVTQPEFGAQTISP